MMLPPDKPKEPPLEICPTNNAIRWQGCYPRKFDNVRMGGRYFYSLSPDEGGDKLKEGWLSCDNGALTDRHFAFRKTSGLNYLPCVSVWNNPSAFEISFDFGGKWRVSRVVLFLAGYIPQIKVEAKKNGRWRVVSSCAEKGPLQPSDVRKLELRLKGPPASFVRLLFGERPEGQRFLIPEVEQCQKPN